MPTLVAPPAMSPCYHFLVSLLQMQGFKCCPDLRLCRLESNTRNPSSPYLTQTQAAYKTSYCGLHSVLSLSFPFLSFPPSLSSLIHHAWIGSLHIRYSTRLGELQEKLRAIWQKIVLANTECQRLNGTLRNDSTQHAHPTDDQRHRVKHNLHMSVWP